MFHTVHKIWIAYILLFITVALSITSDYYVTNNVDGAVVSDCTTCKSPLGSCNIRSSFNCCSKGLTENKDGCNIYFISAYVITMNPGSLSLQSSLTGIIVNVYGNSTKLQKGNGFISANVDFLCVHDLYITEFKSSTIIYHTSGMELNLLGVEFSNCKLPTDVFLIRFEGDLESLQTVIEINDCRFVTSSAYYLIFAKVQFGFIIDSYFFANSFYTTFQVYSGSSWEVRNSHVSRNEGSQGFICSEISSTSASSVVLIDSLFEYNQNLNGNGGVLTIEMDVTVVIDNCQFIGNSAKDKSGAGGAIYLRELNDFIISNSLFEDNSANLGSAITFFGNNVRAWIINTTFNRNHGLLAGCVYFNSYNTNISFHNATFHQNIAGFGPAIVSSLINVIHLISHSRFTDNVGIFGGAIFSLSGHFGMLIEHCYFANNHALGSGGAVYFGEGNFKIFVENCFFIANTGLNGPAIFFETYNDMIYISECTFADNFAYASGGALSFGSKNGRIDINNCTIRNNTAQSTGGGISSQYGISIMTIENSIISHNSAGTGGGGVYFGNSNKDITLRNVTIAHNSLSKNYGGGIAFESHSKNVIINDLLCFGNAVVQGGGGCIAFVDGDNFQLNSSTLIDNSASRGGGLYVEGSSNICLSDSVVEANTAYQGAGIMAIQSKNLELITITLQHNNVTTVGGGVYLDAISSWSLLDSKILHNFAFQYGGGLYVLQATGGYIASCMVHNNVVRSDSGGGVYLKNAFSTSFVCTSFRENTADSGFGGGVYVDSIGSSSILFDSCVFVNNSANAGGGGGIFWTASKDILNHEPINITSDRNFFNDNQALYGPNWATNAIQLALQLNNLTVESYRSPLPSQAVYLQDYYRQVVINSDAYYVESRVVDDSWDCADYNAYLSGSFIEKMNDGLANFTALVPHCSQQGSMKLVYSVTTDSDGDLNATLGLVFRSCERGEYYTNGECMACPSGEYSFSSDFEDVVTCEPCPSGSETCSADQILVKDGYWRQQQNSTTIYACEYSQNCLGGYYTGDDICAVGSYGIMCSSCESGYFLSATTLQCKSCSTSLLSAYMLFFFVLVLLSMTLYCCRVYVSKRLKKRFGTNSGVELTMADEVVEVLHTLRPTVFKKRRTQSEAVEMPIFPYIQRQSNAQTSECDTEKTAPKNSLLERSCSVSDTVLEDEQQREKLVQNVNVLIKRFMAKLKIYTTLYQVLSAFPFVFNQTYPSSYEESSNVFGVVNLDFIGDSAIFQCWYTYDYVGYMMAYTLVPLILIVGGYGVLQLLLLWDGYTTKTLQSVRMSKRSIGLSFGGATRLRMTQRSDTTFFYFLLFTYLVLPAVSTVIFRMFPCHNIDPNNENTTHDNFYLRADYSINCSSDRYFVGVYFAALMGVIYVIGIPLYTFLVLYRCRDFIRDRYGTHTEEMRMVYFRKLKPIRFLFEAYKPKYWYWDICNIVYKLLLVGVLSVIAPSSSLQILIAMGLTAMFLRLHTLCDPYRDDIIGSDMGIVLWQIIVVLLITLLLRHEVFSSHREIVVGCLMVAVFFNGAVDAIRCVIWLAERYFRSDVRSSRQGNVYTADELNELQIKKDYYLQELRKIDSALSQSEVTNVTHQTKEGSGDYEEDGVKGRMTASQILHYDTQDL